MSLKALIVGAGSGVSASFARALAGLGADIALAARNIDKLDRLKQEIDAIAIACDATDADQVAMLFQQVDKAIGTPDVVLFNASAYTAGPITELDPLAVQQSLLLTGYGGFLVAQQAARRMLTVGSGAIFFTGATASNDC